jgi:hypothetical protein
MTDEPTEPDPRVSTSDDGIPLMDEADSVLEEAAMPSGTFDADAADFEVEN